MTIVDDLRMTVDLLENLNANRAAIGRRGTALKG